MKNNTLVQLQISVISVFLFLFHCQIHGQQINIDVKNLNYDADRRLQVLDFEYFETEKKEVRSIHFNPDAKLLIEKVTVSGDFNLLNPQSNYNPKRNATLDIEFDSQCKLGLYEGEVEIITNGPMRRRVIGLKAEVIEKRKSYYLSDDMLNLQGTDSVQAEFKIFNDGNSTLIIEEVKPSVEDVVVICNETTLEPSLSSEISVTIPPKILIQGDQVLISVRVKSCDDNNELPLKSVVLKFSD